MTIEDEKLTKENYKKALIEKTLTDDQIKMLKVNYYSKNETITANQMAQAMGWSSHSSANLHYGKLGRIISERIGYKNDEAEYLYTIVNFEKPGKEWYWILRKEFIQALLELNIIEPKNELEIYEDLTNEIFFEGAKKQITVNLYERDKNTRETCISHYGKNCAACGFNFEEIYGSIASEFIHVHHIKPLSEIKETYKVDPIKDLIPLCPNCHSVVHLVNPPLTIEELKAIMKRKVS